jgi:NAD(P)-dependent dehydrogenase (short-subunit alcohol dehydrogenase family)
LGKEAVKTILITGTSSGFGKLAVPLFLEKGHTVMAGLRGGQARLEAIFGPELKKFSGRLIALDLHMENPDSFQDAVALVERRFGAFEDIPMSTLRHEFDVNFFGPMRLIQLLLPALRAARGRIINVSSIAGRVTYPFYGSYSASKFALEAQTEGLHYELKPFGVQVGLLEPGGFKTEFVSKSNSVVSENSLYGRRVQRLNELFRHSTKRTLGDPARVARKLVSLAEARRVPIRTLIGTDAWLVTILNRILPDSWRVALQELAFRKLIFGD